MNSLRNLAYIVLDLSRRSEEIVKEGVGLLNEVGPIVEQVLSIQTHLRQDQVTKTVREEIVDLLCDAQHTQNEIQAFALFLAKGERVNTATCPFLSKVWYGDMYGETGQEALHNLMNDLNHQYNLLEGHHLVEKILENI